MNMKLSYRDKVIFIVAIIVIILVAGFFLLIRPKFQDIEIAQNNYEAKVAERESVDAKIGTLPTIVENLKAAATAVGEEQGIFLEEQDPYLNEIYLREALARENLSYESINTTYAQASDISRYTVTPQHLLAYDNKINTDLYNELPQEIYDLYNGVPPTSYPGATIGVTTMTFTYMSDDIALDFRVLDRIAEDEKTIILNTISSSVVDPNDPEDNRKTTCTITMYSIFPLNVEQVLQESDEVQIASAE